MQDTVTMSIKPPVNTKIIVKSIGEVELRYLTIGDVTKAWELIARPEASGKDIVIDVLFKQLLRPRITFEQFRNIDENELMQIVRAFVKNENHVFQYFNETGDFFKDFATALRMYREREFKTGFDFEPTFLKLQKQLQESLTKLSSLTERTSPIIQMIREAENRFRTIFSDMHKVEMGNMKAFRQLVEQETAFARLLTDSLRPQFEYWRQWAELHQSVLAPQLTIWEDFQKTYHVTQKKASRVLRKYKWFVSPSLPVPLISQIVNLGMQKGRKDRQIARLFVGYFSAKNWRNLDSMVNHWAKNPLFKKRMKIIRDCVSILKSMERVSINYALVILPVLIAQIDGVLTDYLKSKGIPFERLYDDSLKGGAVKKAGRKGQFKRHIAPLTKLDLDKLSNHVFLDILFQTSQRGKPLKTPFNFNRHRIMHGEIVTYGKIEYLVRAFMVLDFLAHLK